MLKMIWCLCTLLLAERGMNGRFIMKPLLQGDERYEVVVVRRRVGDPGELQEASVPFWNKGLATYYEGRTN